MSDKNRWFTTEDHSAIIKCTMEHLVDFLAAIYGDMQRARRNVSCFREVTLKEYAEYQLYND